MDEEVEEEEELVDDDEEGSIFLVNRWSSSDIIVERLRRSFC
jgi:hypothetical protein